MVEMTQKEMKSVIEDHENFKEPENWVDEIKHLGEKVKQNMK